MPLRAEFTFYSVKGYANFPQCSNNVEYLFPTYLSMPSRLDVASFFIISFSDMFPSFFPFWNGKRVENDRINDDDTITLHIRYSLFSYLTFPWIVLLFNPNRSLGRLFNYSRLFQVCLCHISISFGILSTSLSRRSPLRLRQRCGQSARNKY